MNQLITSSSTIRMTSREIAELTGKRHDHVMADIRSMLHQLDLGTPEFSGVYFAENNQQYDCFNLPKDLTLTLVAGYSVVLRKRIIDRWLELEAQTTAPVPTSFAAALRLAAEQQERIEQQTQQLEAAKPALEFVDKYVDATGSKGFRQVCKLLNANESEFRLFLQAKKIMYRLNGEWVPHSCHMDAGRFEVKAGVAGLSQHAFNQAQFTPKGINWVAGEWAKYQLESAIPA